MTDDYEDLIITDEETNEKRLVTEENINVQEVNLIYVAATRAKQTLQINVQLRNLLKFLKEVQHGSIS